MNKNHIPTKIESWILAILVFTMACPYYLWVGSLAYLYYLSRLLFFVYSCKFIDFKINKYSFLSLLLLLFNFYFAWRLVNNNDLGVRGYIMQTMWTMFTIPIFFCFPFFWKKVLHKFSIILSIALIPSIIQYCLYSFFDKSFSSWTIPESVLNPDREYSAFLFFCRLKASGIASFPRFYGYFDEPGFLGNIAMVLLFINKFNLKKWYNIVILLAGLLSFSLVFYIAIALYLLLFVKMKYKILICLLALIIVPIAYNNQDLYELLFRRFEITDDGLSGYNRENAEFIGWFKYVDVEDFVMPYKGIVPYSASWLYVTTLYGIIPSVLYFYVLFKRAFVLLHFSKEFFLYVILFFVIWIQRPFVWFPFFQILMIAPIYVYYINNYEKRTINITYKESI